MKKRLLIILNFFAIGLIAQQDAQYSLYVFNQQYLNPAYVGTSEKSKFTLIYRDQWFSFQNSSVNKITPHSISAGMDLKMKNGRYGFGTLFHFDHVGYGISGSITPSFSFIIPTKKETKISLGIQANLMLFDDRREKSDLDNFGDPTYIDRPMRFLPNAGAGIYIYDNELYYIGLGIPQILNYNLSNGSLSDLQNAARNSVFSRQHRHYFLHAGMMFPRWSKSALIHYLPSVLFKFVELNQESGSNIPDLDLINRIILKQRVAFGIGLRMGGDREGPYFESVIGLFNITLGSKKNYAHELGFAYDYSLSDLGNINNFSIGSFEILYKIRFGSDNNYSSPAPAGQFITSSPF